MSDLVHLLGGVVVLVGGLMVLAGFHRLRRP